jgi:hypothetical protein
MRCRQIVLLIFVIGLALTACDSFAQGGGTTPPTCCTKEDPPPSGGNSAPLAITATDSMPVVTISDAALRDKGMTRSQFLDRVAEALLPDSLGNVLLVIPVLQAVTAADGSVTYQTSYYAIEKSQITAEVLAAVTALYMTDGQTVIGINFIPDPAS